MQIYILYKCKSWCLYENSTSHNKSPQSNDIFLIRTMIRCQCDLIIQSLWLPCLVMCPAGSSYVHRQPCHRKTSDTCISLLGGSFGVFGVPVSSAEATTSAWSATSSQLVRALKLNSDKGKNPMPLGMFSWSEWINSVSCIFWRCQLARMIDGNPNGVNSISYLIKWIRCISKGGSEK